jgi:hypothetical protein
MNADGNIETLFSAICTSLRSLRVQDQSHANLSSEKSCETAFCQHSIQARTRSSFHCSMQEPIKIHWDPHAVAMLLSGPQAIFASR